MSTAVSSPAGINTPFPTPPYWVQPRRTKIGITALLNTGNDGRRFGLAIDSPDIKAKSARPSIEVTSRRETGWFFFPVSAPKRRLVLGANPFPYADWLSKQPGVPRWVCFVPYALVLTFVGSMIGTLGGLSHAFHAVENVDPENKAQFLTDGISRAMNFTAAALAFDAVVLVALPIITWTRQRPARP